jgi:hypothetical protein
MREALRVKIVSQRYNSRDRTAAFWFERSWIRLRKSFVVSAIAAPLALVRALLARLWPRAAQRLVKSAPRPTDLFTKSFRVELNRRNEILSAIILKTHNIACTSLLESGTSSNWSAKLCEVAVTTEELFEIFGPEMRKGVWPHYEPSDVHLILMHV